MSYGPLIVHMRGGKAQFSFTDAAADFRSDGSLVINNKIGMLATFAAGAWAAVTGLTL